ARLRPRSAIPRRSRARRRPTRGGGGRVAEHALTPIIRELRLHAEAALLRRLNAGSGFADPRVPSQIYLRDDAALARLAGGTLRPQGTHRTAEAELERALAE